VGGVRVSYRAGPAIFEASLTRSSGGEWTAAFAGLVELDTHVHRQEFARSRVRSERDVRKLLVRQARLVRRTMPGA
jgi:hypothetical protein